MNRGSIWAALALAGVLTMAARARAADRDQDGLEDPVEPGDTDGDGIVDALDPDDDGDGIFTRFERGSPTQPVDSDGDGRPDHRDVDDDNDGVDTRDERPDPDGDGDPSDAISTANSIADYLNADDDGDGVSTFDERPGGVDRDSDGDMLVDHRDEDDDNDGLFHESAIDHDRDGKPDYLDVDDDGDGVPSAREHVPGIDTDRDGLSDPRDTDDDGDGLMTADELGDPRAPRDSDGDTTPDYLDADDDGDTVSTLAEGARDSDGDGIRDHLDADDDGDGIATRTEAAVAADVDGDGQRNALDLDSDGDGVSDEVEGEGDADGDGIPNFVDALAAHDGGTEDDGGAADAGLVGDGGGLTFSQVSAEEGCSASGRSGARGSMLVPILFGLCLWARRRRASSLAALLAGALAVGCGDDDPESVLSLDGSFAPIDGGADARIDATTIDAASDVDAGEPRSECAIDGERWSRAIDSTHERAFAALLHEDAVHVAYVVPTCGRPAQATGTRIDHTSVRSTGAAAAERTITGDPEGACRIRRAPALTLASSGQLELYYTTNTSGSAEIHRQDIALTQPAQRITVDPSSAIDSELATVAAAWGDAPLLAYVNESAPSLPSQLVTRRPGAAENEVVATSAAQSPSRLALVAFPPPASIAGLIGWVSERAGAFSLRLQALAPAGAPQGVPLELSTRVGSLSQIALAATAERAAAVYVVQSGSVGELRFQALDRAGLPVGSEMKLTAGNRTVSTPSMTAYANGYAIAFREQPDSLAVPSSIRLLFVAADGRVAGERRLTDAARAGGATQLFVMNDGRLIVLYSDYDAGSATLHALRARCL